MPEAVAREVADSTGTYFVIMESETGMYDADAAQLSGRWLKCATPVHIRP